MQLLQIKKIIIFAKILFDISMPIKISPHFNRQ